MPIEIIPAILPQDFTELKEKVGLIKSLVKTIQIDICDGQYVPSTTWPYDGDDGEFERIIHEEEGLPAWEGIDYEFDLMVNRPEDVADRWVVAGASRVVLHAESNGDIGKAIGVLKGRVEVGLALDIDTPIERISDIGSGDGKIAVQFVQCMGIDRVGFQGQDFDAKVLEKILAIKTKYPGLAVSVDGGVSFDNALQLIQSGADRLVIGSAIFGSDNAADALRKFLEFINK